MKAHLIILIILLSNKCIAQTDSTIITLIREDNTEFYNRKNIPDDLKKSCNKIWGIKKSTWFRRAFHGGSSKKHGGDYSRKVTISYKTNSYYVVLYREIKGRGILSKLIVLNNSFESLGIFELDFYPNNIEEVKAGLRAGKYRISTS